ETSKSQVAQLTQLKELASWNLRVVVPKTQIASGFSELGVKALFEVAYGTLAPRVTRRTALAALSKWASSMELSELSELFIAHREFCSSKRALDKVAKLNFIAYESDRKVSGKHQFGEEYFVLLESLRINAGSQAADNLLWVANFIGKLETKVFGEGTDHAVQTEWLNHSLQASGYTGITIAQGDSSRLDRISARAPKTGLSNESPLVSVILPAFNSEKWISTAIQSLLAQTWTALEVLVVDDCSTDSTYAIAKSFEALDQRVRVMRAKTNSGPYHCRNIALKQAKGDYVTVHDADDWSHPQKIEVQVRHLEANPSLIANVSEGARVDEASLITGVVGRTQILRPNFSSLMFRRKPVTEALGFWDEVRFGGDSEFQYRLIGYFGQESFAILKTGLLSLLRVVEGSLTAGGMQELLSGARKYYKQSFQKWHSHLADSGESHYLDPTSVRRFYAPNASLNKFELDDVRDLLVVADFSEPMSEIKAVMTVIGEALKNGLTISIGHVPSLKNPTANSSSEIEAFAIANNVGMLWHVLEESGEAALLRVRQVLATESAVAAKYDRLPKIEAQDGGLMVANVSNIDTETLATLTSNFKSMFGELPNLLTFGEEVLTTIRDIKWMTDISSGTSLPSIDNQPNSKSEL
ncbi:MAG: glycosyltransferase family 2 protein, partial [Microbacteriaceae bacterium]|nr:glycosyltransferase family 2 protein [Microbacteriaceae bacterium]